MKSVVIGACLKAENNPFWAIDVRKGLEEASKNFPDVRLQYRTPQRITGINEQQKIIKQFITQKVDAIILAPSDPIKLASSIKKINRAKIPLIIIDSRLDESIVQKHHLSFKFIGFDDYKGGYETGLLLKSKLSPQSHVAVIEGASKGSYTQRVTGFKDAVQNYFTISKVISANFEEDEAYHKTKLLLFHYPELKAIFCTSDNMAMGCLTALYEAERQDILVSSFDGTYAGKLALEKGRLFSTVNTNPQEMGRRAIQTAHELLLGHCVADETQYFIRVLTADRLQKLPKHVVQKRRYVLVKPDTRLREFDYASLHNSYDCPIILGHNLSTDLPLRLKALNADKYCIITDSIVEKLYGRKLLTTLRKNDLESNLFAFPAGETHKTFTILNSLASEVLSNGITKNSCLVVLGGGVVGNVAGLLAALLMRGIRFVHVPTTVMAQVDSTTGGKQAVNTPHGKNLLGTFYEPEFIYIDFSIIKTLPPREYHAGMAEVIKHALCQSPQLLHEKKYEQIVEKTIQLKTHVMDTDPREQHEGLVLVYGHTIGHALEIASNHTLNHGEAISIGMVAAARISQELGFCSPKLVQIHESILHKYKLPIRIPKKINLNTIEKTLLYDKKERKSQIPFVLLEDAGKIKTINGKYSIPIKREIIQKVLRELV